jgi:phosphatidylglycerol:prolipoprotein diacylglycerol transferase
VRQLPRLPWKARFGQGPFRVVIPYFEQPVLHLGPVNLYAFGILVAVAMLAGIQGTLVRCRKLSLDTDLCADLLFTLLIAAFVSAHLFAVLAYFPREAAKNPWMILKIWENISSFGGIIGALFGIWLFFRWKSPPLPPGTAWRYLDVIAFVFPFAWAIGRLGCTVAHDHPGTVTNFPLGVSLSTPEARAYLTYFYRTAGRLKDLPEPARLARMAYHDLGWYEFLYTLLVLCPAFLVLDRKPRPTGFYPLAFLLLYLPVRFFLDFLRISDARYAGLTFGQYAAIAGFAAAGYVVLRRSVSRSP